MHQQEQILENMNQDYSHNLYGLLKIKLTTQLMVFLFSILFSFFFIFFLQYSSMISNLSTFSFMLLSFSTNKNYIFLLCNGILIFIAKYSSRQAVQNNHPPSQTEIISPDHNNDLSFKGYTWMLLPSMEDKSAYVEDVAMKEDEEVQISEANEEVINNGEFFMIDGIQTEEEDDDHDIFDDDDDDDDDIFDDDDDDDDVGGDDDDDDGHDNNKEYVKEESEKEEEEEEGGNAKMSTEELNRKFEDFIRKMKEELRIEAQHQLIMI